MLAGRASLEIVPFGVPGLVVINRTHLLLGARPGLPAGSSILTPCRRDEPELGRDIVQLAGGELIFAVGFTPGGAPNEPRAEIVDGELRFPDDEPPDLNTKI